VSLQNPFIGFWHLRLLTSNLGGVFPLITQQMYMRLGYGPASSLLGGIGTLLTIVPWILVFYGPKIRARSKFASEIMKTQ
jgi:hypothetical protein